MWNFDLVDHYIRKLRPLRLVDYAEALASQVTADEALKWCAEDTATWANESHAIAVEYTYKDIPADGDPPKIEQQYIDSQREVVESQLKRAGVRLAAALNEALNVTDTGKEPS